MRIALAVAIVAALSAAGIVAPASGVRLQGSSATAAYLQQVAKGGTGDEFENRTRVFERLRFDLTDVAGPQLSFHGFLTARNDVSNQSIGDTRARLYRGYLQYRSVPVQKDVLRYDARIGRQWVSAGVGSGTVDGAFVQLDRPGWGGITAFGGTLGADAREQWRLDEPKDSRRLGGELRLRPRIGDAIEPEGAFSIAYTRRHDIDESQRLGGRASLRIRRQLRLYSEVRHDLLLDRTYGNAAGVEFLKPSRGLRAWAEYNRRTPALPATSYFAFFDTRPVSELRGGIGFGIGGPYRLGFDFARSDFKRVTPTAGDATRTRSKVDRSNSYRLTAQRGAIQIGGRIQSGFGGDRSGLVVSAMQDFGERLSVNVDLGFETYDYGPTGIEDNGVASGILAATYSLAPDTKITAQVEGLNNRDLKQDVRLLARVDQRFRLGR